MSDWSKYELRTIAEADDLHIAPFRQDEVTYGTRAKFGAAAFATPRASGEGW